MLEELTDADLKAADWAKGLGLGWGYVGPILNPAGAMWA